MTARISLRTKVLLVAVLNIVLVAVALVWFARTQLGTFGTLLLGESRDRVAAVALQLARELPSTSSADRDVLLARYSAEHGVTFALFQLDGTQVAGTPLALPAPVAGYLKLVRQNSPFAQRSGGRPGALPFAGPDAGILRDPPFFARAASASWAVSRMLIRWQDAPSLQPGMLVLTSPRVLGNPFFFNLTPWFQLVGLLALITLACWLPLVRGATRSIANLAAASSRIASGAFSARVESTRADELGRLGESFNKMAAQLDGLVHGQKRFLRDAAHELRSPLARMQAALGNIMECREELGPESERFLEDLREEIDLMSTLTGELLALARDEDARALRTLAAVNLSETAARVIATENPGGLADVRMQIDPSLTVTAHADSLFRGLSNVVRNAIRYAGHAGPITMSAELHDRATVVTIADAGPGIPEAALEMVFTPFFRLDGSRDRTTGGHGLGMAIARSCIESCGGTIYCRNGKPGLEAVITLVS